MTKREAAIVSAFTDRLIGDVADLYLYLEEVVGRSIMTHEVPSIMGDKENQKRFKQDFISIEITEEKG